MRGRARISAWSALLPAYACLVALLVGFGSAYVAVSGPFPFGLVRVGPWRSWPRAGSRDIDPYARAILARRGAVPLGIGEGLELEATTDDGDRPLDPACRYRIGRSVPAARAWTLTLYGEDGAPARTELGRSGFTSAEILRDQDGGFDIVLSRSAAPGNWLQAPAGGRFTMVLRLYDSPVPVGSAALERRTLPAIENLGCAP